MDRKPDPAAVWNRLMPEEREVILREAMRQPELSPRELAFYLIDRVGLSVSESTVYRVLKRHGLIREVKGVGFRTC